jgi:hypothetical protein
VAAIAATAGTAWRVLPLKIDQQGASVQEDGQQPAPCRAERSALLGPRVPAESPDRNEAARHPPDRQDKQLVARETAVKSKGVQQRLVERPDREDAGQVVEELEVTLKYVPDMKTSGKKMNWTTAGAASALRTRLTSSPS